MTLPSDFGLSKKQKAAPGTFPLKQNVGDGSRGKANPLASDLSDGGECPFPSSHDKLTEAHYFMHQMLDNYHYPIEFRYNLNAFLQAARSTTLLLQTELPKSETFEKWYENEQRRMAQDEDLKLLNSLRVTVVHKSSLVPASTMWMGLFKYDERRLGFGNFSDPMIASFGALLTARRHLQGYVHPHRMWVGEELGIERIWALEQAPERELVGFCISAWERIARIVKDAHRLAGAVFEPSAKCKHGAKTYGRLLESDIFPEVGTAWAGAGPPTHEVLPNKKINLLAEPWTGSEIIHSVAAPKVVKGWVGGQSKWWSPHFISMLIYSIGDEVIRKDTAVFFEHRKAIIRELPEEAEHEIAGSEKSDT
jgi:hypothetical protein